MMKAFKKLTAVFLLIISSAFILVLFSSCREQENVIDPNKTQLLIGNYDGGFGHEWLYQAVEIFEERFKDVSFQPGKTGVQILVTNQKDELSGSNYNFYVALPGLEYDLFITQTPRMEIQTGNLIKDLTDLLDEPLTEFGEDRTIREKLKDYLFDCYFDKNKIQYLPYGESYFGIIVYDVDLFEEKEYFFAKNGGFTGKGEKSAGRDGIYGTYDDGTPATEEEFFTLLQRIYGMGDTPLTWAGMYDSYMNGIVFNWVMNYDEGATQKAYNTLTGSIVDYQGNTVPISEANYWQVQTSAAKLAALKATKKLISNSNYYSSNAFKSTQTHIEAQDEFLTSVLSGKRIAMLIEGTWWENEALDTFNRMAKNNSDYAFKKRRFGVMPGFKPNGAFGEKTGFITCYTSVFINANTNKEDLARLFIKFLYTDEILRLYTRVTGSPQSCDYELTPEEYESLSYFGKQLYEISKGDYVFVTEDRTSRLFWEMTDFYPHNFMSNVIDPGGTRVVTCPFLTFFYYPSTTPEQYFEGLWNYAKLRWSQSDMQQYLARRGLL